MSFPQPRPLKLADAVNAAPGIRRPEIPRAVSGAWSFPRRPKSPRIAPAFPTAPQTPKISSLSKPLRPSRLTNGAEETTVEAVAGARRNLKLLKIGQKSFRVFDDSPSDARSSGQCRPRTPPDPHLSPNPFPRLRRDGQSLRPRRDSPAPDDSLRTVADQQRADQQRAASTLASLLRVWSVRHLTECAWRRLAAPAASPPSIKVAATPSSLPDLHLISDLEDRLEKSRGKWRSEFDRLDAAQKVVREDRFMLLEKCQDSLRRLDGVLSSLKAQRTPKAEKPQSTVAVFGTLQLSLPPRAQQPRSPNQQPRSSAQQPSVEEVFVLANRQRHSLKGAHIGSAHRQRLRLQALRSWRSISDTTRQLVDDDRLSRLAGLLAREDDRSTRVTIASSSISDRNRSLVDLPTSFPSFSSAASPTNLNTTSSDSGSLSGSVAGAGSPGASGLAASSTAQVCGLCPVKTPSRAKPVCEAEALCEWLLLRCGPELVAQALSHVASAQTGLRPPSPSSPRQQLSDEGSQRYAIDLHPVGRAGGVGSAAGSHDGSDGERAFRGEGGLKLLRARVAELAEENGLIKAAIWSLWTNESRKSKKGMSRLIERLRKALVTARKLDYDRSLKDRLLDLDQRRFFDELITHHRRCHSVSSKDSNSTPSHSPVRLQSAERDGPPASRPPPESVDSVQSHKRHTHMNLAPLQNRVRHFRSSACVHTSRETPRSPESGDWIGEREGSGESSRESASHITPGRKTAQGKARSKEEVEASPNLVQVLRSEGQGPGSRQQIKSSVESKKGSPRSQDGSARKPCLMAVSDLSESEKVTPLQSRFAPRFRCESRSHTSPSKVSSEASSGISGRSGQREKPPNMVEKGHRDSVRRSSPHISVPYRRQGILLSLEEKCRAEVVDGARISEGFVSDRDTRGGSRLWPSSRWHLQVRAC